MNKIKAVFFDIDGTLVSFKTHRVPESTVEALQALRAKGIKVFISTGRMLPDTQVVSHIPFDGYITCNGSCCFNAEKEMFYSNPIPKQNLEALVEYLDTHSFPVCFMTGKEMVAGKEDPEINELIQMLDIIPPRVEDPRITIRKPIYQINLFLREKDEGYVMQHILKDCVGNRWSDLFSDVNRKGNTKQAGIDWIIEHYGFDLSETMAFGDGGNDISMLRHAAIGVAMGNAREEVQTSADYVTALVDEDGIAKALRHFGLL